MVDERKDGGKRSAPAIILLLLSFLEKEWMGTCIESIFYELALYFNLFQARKFGCIVVSLSSTQVPKACTSRLILGH